MSLEPILTEWDELSKEFNKLEVSEIQTEVEFQITFSKSIKKLFITLWIQDVSNEYGELLEKLEQLQQKCMKDISHQRYRLSQISSNLKK